ncbi:MAG: hypothetical protein JSS49_24915 [Planctomycetes bacterium]|nr:hypothetical protein [Planctomycetota bacterium]
MQKLFNAIRFATHTRRLHQQARGPVLRLRVATSCQNFRTALVVAACAEFFFAGVRVGYAQQGPSNQATSLEPLLARLHQKAANEVISLDSELFLFWYLDPASIVAAGGHDLESKQARQLLLKLAEKWTEAKDPDALVSLSQDMGVTSQMMKGMWNRARIVWEPGKYKNTFTSFADVSVSSVCDGKAEWSYIESSHQVTAYEMPSKWGHFQISSLRKTVDASNEAILIADADDYLTIKYTVGSENVECNLSKLTGCLTECRTTSGELVQEYFAHGFEEMDETAPGVLFPRASVNAVFYKGKLAKAEMFFTQSARINREIFSDDYALPVPAGTTVWYAGDLAPKEEGAAHAARKLVALKTENPCSDVRELLPLLREKDSNFKRQSQRIPISAPQSRGRGTYVLAINAIIVLILCLSIAAKRRLRIRRQAAEKGINK